MVRDCRHYTGDGQRLQTLYRRWSETADIVQETVRDCRHYTVDGQRLQTSYRRRSETADIVQVWLENVLQASQKLEQCQRDAEQVTVLMKNNVDKVFEREGKLEILEGRAEELKCMASNFQKTAQTVERKTRWEKWRWYIICAVIVIVILLIISIILAVQFSGESLMSSDSNCLVH
uniref:V-SNARE coiled-coil homology domain-containing protein n=2 Tax=Pyxicephalus adspersus TaxID=30357 RepID=A0AAV3B7C6_PYXAD|nr:TPA: hypothetical protein GDO54_007859 [Pyxicephalus adspersus]